ncbi:MAG: hypothetical protein P0S94_04445 [Simkaniaceae bacterium]|nr:hypothetical protein [Simkaniaceae bacterium]
MNIVPFVLFLIVALASFSAAFFQKGVDLKVETDIMLSYAETERKNEQQIQEKSFAKIQEAPKPRKPGEKKESSEEKQKERTSRRILAAGTPAAKLNLLAAIEKKEQKTVIALFKHLYAPHFSCDVLAALAEHLIAKKVTSFHDLYPENEDLSHLYYTLLRGTRHYDLTTKEGYPPLSDFIDLCEGDHLFAFKTAAPEIITAHFGNELAQKIFQEEKKLLEKPKEKRKDLTKGEVEKIARNAMLIQNLSFDVPSLYENSGIIAATDEITKLRVTKRID